MEWIDLTEEKQIDSIIEASKINPVVVFKHSTRCSISAAAKGRLERDWNKEEMKEINFYYLDLIQFRSISNELAEVFGVTHESPQVLVIENGKCTYNTAHMNISYRSVKEKLLTGV